ncbi:response regulator [Jatrophihabitans endophyticus]|uniref:response regulator n=1 Tax=Jatrophihabitans endophyticus TaxID=1206085 RepID=UPI0019E3EDBD|nr:response regulator [Jatrophihabitans endophyticus]
MIHVLAVDDEPHLLRALSMNLGARGYQVSAVATGRAALTSVAESHPDVLVLDLGLPDVSGLDVIRLIRAHDDELPILVLSARSGSQDKVAALDLGANDYVTKPFDMNELLARLRAMTRRTRAADEQTDPITFGVVTVDLRARIVRRADGVDTSDTPDGGRDDMVHLTRTEWRMLETLLRRPGMLTTPAELLIAMRGDPQHTEQSYLRIYMQQLRRKLEADPTRPRHLLTEPGLGYRFLP